MSKTDTRSKTRVGVFLHLLKKSFAVLQQNDPLRMAGATAFFTTFALPPIMIILFQLFSLFLSKRTVGSEIMETLTSTLGAEGAEQLRRTTRGLRTLAQSWYLAVAGFLFLLFIATTLFLVIRNTLNDIWNIKMRHKRGLLYSLKVRFQSSLFIAFTGVIFIIGVGIETVQAVAGNFVASYSAEAGAWVKILLSQVTGIIVITVWFILLFRFIADARPAWRVTIAGGLLTGILFFAGRALLGFLLQKGNVTTVYGASGAIVLVLLFVFYSSFILYFGASFIRVYADLRRQPVQPLRRATRYQEKEIG